MIWTLTAWQVEGSYSELVLEGLKTTLFCEPDMQSANESVSPLRARKGWPVPWPAGSVSACGSGARRQGREEGASAAEEGAKTGEKARRRRGAGSNTAEISQNRTRRTEQGLAGRTTAQ